MQTTRVTICACASRSFIDKDKVAGIAAVLKNKGYHVIVEADLCRKVMEASPDMPDVAQGTILACHLRAIESHLNWLGFEAGQLVDIRNQGTHDILSQFDIAHPDTENVVGKDEVKKVIGEFPLEEGVDAWYPVLDKNRCTECGKCHDFCLFGVYTVENKKVRVTNPRNCKNNCPACARMCPSKAIIFPKYEKSPINGGTAEDETFDPQEMDKIYRERLRIRLQERRAGVSLLKRNPEEK